MSLTISETDSLQNNSGGDEIQIYPTYLTYSFYSFYSFFPFYLFYSPVGSDETQLNYGYSHMARGWMRNASTLTNAQCELEFNVG